METSISKWRALTQPAGAVEFFRGLFERVGVHVTDTDEAFTCVHKGDRIDLHEGLEPDGIDYVVEIKSHQVDRLAEHVRTGALDELEQYRIVGALFTPATAAMLKNPIMSQPSLRRLAGVEDLIHVRLNSPSSKVSDVSHTLIYANRQWLVFPGLHGTPARVYELDAAQALEYQRRAFEALKVNNLGGWTSFANWYRDWRKAVSASGAKAARTAA